MRKDPLLILAVSILSSFAGGCTKHYITAKPDSSAIGFSLSDFSDTRAAINNVSEFALGSSFDVWGYYTSASAGKVDVFNHVPVVKSDKGWGYSGGDRFWVKDVQYDFYSVYPSGAGNALEGETIKVSGFDCSATGADAVDLMTAVSKGISYGTDQTPQPVALNFSHELARVKFIAKSAGSNVTINSISLVGAGTVGNFNLNASTEPKTRSWTISGHSDETGPFSKTDVDLNPDGTEVDVYGDMMVLPLQNLEGVTLKVEYTYAGETVPVQHELKLSEATAKNWSAGQSYRYRITVPVQSSDLKLEVSVLPWDKVDDAYVEW